MVRIIDAENVARPFFEQLERRSGRPVLRAFLASNDQAALEYAQSTGKACEKAGITFELKKVDQGLEEQIIEANLDSKVHAIMVYYPVFGSERDQYIQNCVSPIKDAEGLSHLNRFNLYHNNRYFDPPLCTRKCILPCTPLAIIKIIEHLKMYNNKRLDGKIVSIFNRSEIVGRPLAAMLLNDGATVYSIDDQGVYNSAKSISEVLEESDIIVSGVPSPTFQIPLSKVKDSSVWINFSQYQNINTTNLNETHVFVPKIGKVTVAMLLRNVWRLYDQNKLET